MLISAKTLFYHRERIPTEKYNLLILLQIDPVSLLVCPTKSHSQRSLSRAYLLHEENGGNVSESSRDCVQHNCCVGQQKEYLNVILKIWVTERYNYINDRQLS